MKPKINFITYDEDISIKDVNKSRIKNSLNPFYCFSLIRKVKQCNILHYYYSKRSISSNLFNILFPFLVKFPHGPAVIILVSNTIATKLRLSDEILFKSASIIEVFSEESKKTLIDQGIKEEKISVLDKELSNIEADHKKAFFLNECGHPSWIYQQKNQRERIDWLKNNSSGKKLEIGCATGYIINHVGGGVGVDLDNNRLEYARSKYPNSSFILADATKMNFKDNEFDTVLIPEILEHVPFQKAKEIVKECKRIGKKLLITIPNASKPNYDKNLVENPEHLWLPTKEKVFELFGENIKIDYTKNKDFMLILSTTSYAR